MSLNKQFLLLLSSSAAPFSSGLQYLTPVPTVLCTPQSERYPPMFSSKCVITLSLTFRSTVYLELIFIYMYVVCNAFLVTWIANQCSTFYGKDHLFSTILQCCICHRPIWPYMYVGLFPLQRSVCLFSYQYHTLSITFYILIINLHIRWYKYYSFIPFQVYPSYS